MREGARKQGYPEPEFSANVFFTAVFRPLPAMSGQDIPKSGPAQAHDEAHDEAHEPINIIDSLLLKACASEPQSTSDLLQCLGYKTRTGNFKAAISHLLARGYLEMTIPDKPRSQKQRYRITAKGRFKQ